MMNNDWDTRAFGGKSPEEAGFATVRVDNVWRFYAQGAGKIEQGAEIFPRVHRTNEIRDDRKSIRVIREARLHGTFAANCGSRNQPDLDIGSFSETEDSGDCVLLSATHYKPSDYMSNPHARVQIREARPSAL